MGRLVSEVFRDQPALARRVKQLHDELASLNRDLDNQNHADVMATNAHLVPKNPSAITAVCAVAMSADDRFGNRGSTTAAMTATITMTTMRT